MKVLMKTVRADGQSGSAVRAAEASFNDAMSVPIGKPEISTGLHHPTVELTA